MSEDGPTASKPRPGLIAGAALLLLLLALCVAAAAWLPLRAPQVLAGGLQSVTGGVEQAFTAEVGEALRAEVRTELRAQAGWLAGLDASALPPEQVRAAAAPAEHLSELLADGRLDPEDCRSFLTLSRRHRGERP